MFRISEKCIIRLTSFNIQNVHHTSIGRQPSKANKIKKLMKEFKTVFGELAETKAQKKRRLKLERKGKMSTQKLNKEDTEFPWVMANHGSNLKKITISAKQQNEQEDIARRSLPCTSEVHQSETTNINSFNQDFVNHLRNFTETYKNRKKPAKKFSKVILKIKTSTDQNDNILDLKSDQVTNKLGFENTSPTFSSLTNTKDIDSDNNKTTSAIESSNPDQNTAETNNFRKNGLLSNSNASDIENATVKHNTLSNHEGLPDIVVKNLPYFSIMDSKQKSSEDSTGILCISGKDDLETIRFPSVTKILTRTMPMESRLALEAWKERMIQKLGQEGFDIHQKALLEDGASLHACIADSLWGREYEVPSKIEPVFKSVRSVLEDVHHVKAIETHVAHPKLRYKGIIDCVASYRGENYVIDWKRSDKKKLNLKETYDAPLQIAAYIGAINSSNIYPFVIKRGLLVIGYTCGTPATVHQVCDDTLQRYWTAWLHRLQKYYVEAGSDDSNNTTARP